MGEREAFMDRIRRDPADDTVRLVFADWLEERGDDPEWAAFIRSQIRREKWGGSVYAIARKVLGPIVPKVFGWRSVVAGKTLTSLRIHQRKDSSITVAPDYDRPRCSGIIHRGFLTNFVIDVIPFCLHAHVLFSHPITDAGHFYRRPLGPLRDDTGKDWGWTRCDIDDELEVEDIMFDRSLLPHPLFDELAESGEGHRTPNGLIYPTWKDSIEALRRGALSWGRKQFESRGVE